jgi:hypothetical protein
MNKKIVILLSATIITLTCCETQNKIHISDNLIERIAKEDQKFPSQFGNLIFFVRCDDDKIIRFEVHYFRDLYRLSTLNIGYETYLRNLLNQNLKINCNNVFNNTTKKFEPDSAIYSHFNKKHLKEFINFYCRKRGDDYILNEKDLTENQINTVLYLLFVNNYMSGSDDYLGAYIINKFDK